MTLDSYLNERYRNAFFFALGLHVLVVILLTLDPQSHSRPVLEKDTQNELGSLTSKVDIVKAVTVDEKALEHTIEQLKQAKLQEKRKEEAHQQALKKEADDALAKRVAEQKHLEAVKREAEAIALKRKQAIEKEKKALKALAEQKLKAQKSLAETKAKQALLKKEAIKQAAESQRAQAVKATQAAEDMAKRARIAGEVDKYKALILNAISRQWILPENVQPGLSSQFRIRLAPTGAVLEVALLRSSGDPILDRSAQTAIYKASPLPVPAEADVFDVFREISLTVRPEQLVRG